MPIGGAQHHLEIQPNAEYRLFEIVSVIGHLKAVFPEEKK
jgi:hypothetical protein